MTMNTDVTNRERVESELASPQVADIESAGHVVAVAHRPAVLPASAPLLERLDDIAAKQNRSRENLVSDILWNYVREHGND